MNLQIQLRAVALISSMILFTAHAARGGDSDLLSRIPAGANAIAVIDVDKLMSSPMAAQEQWKDKMKNAYATNSLIVPPDASRLMLAAMLDPSTMHPAWEVAVMNLKTAPSMEKIARAEGGFVELVSEKQAAWSPVNAYFIRLDNHMLGTVSPANRQFAARWAARGTNQGEMDSPYLKSAVAAMDGKAAYLFAMDLGDATSSRKVKRRIDMGDFESLAGKTVDADKISQVIASIKGITLSVVVGEELSGSGAIEFGQPTSALTDFAKPLLLEVLGKFGVAIDDFQGWNVKASGSKLALSGALTTEGFRQLLRIVDPPSPQSAGDAQAAASEGQKGDGDAAKNAATVAASRQYYQAVAKILDNVGKQIRNSTSMTQGSTWVARDARNIDRLSLVNVDPDLVNWGIDVSSKLRDLASTVGIGGLQTRARTVAIQEGYGSGTGSDEVRNESSHNYNDDIARQNTQRQRLSAAAEEKAKVAQSATQIYRDLETSRAGIRAAMVQKYKADF